MLAKSVLLTVFLTFIIVLIELRFKSLCNFRFYCTGSCLLYFVIACIGNTSATMIAALLLNQTAESAVYPGYEWFWYSMVGVFGFEVIIQHINITFLDKGILAFNTWINMAQTSAVASIATYAAAGDMNDKQIIATELVKKAGERVSTYALQTLGEQDYQSWVVVASSNPGIQQDLLLALALVERDAKKAEAIVKSYKGGRSEPAMAAATYPGA